MGLNFTIYLFITKIMTNSELKRKASLGKLTVEEWLKFGGDLGEELNRLRGPIPTESQHTNKNENEYEVFFVMNNKKKK